MVFYPVSLLKRSKMNAVQVVRRAEFYSDLVPLTNAITATPADFGAYNAKATKTSSIETVTFASEINNDITANISSYPDSAIVTDSAASIYDIVSSTPTSVKAIKSSESSSSSGANAVQVPAITKKASVVWGIICTSILLSFL